jgi:hypothetical protein
VRVDFDMINEWLALPKFLPLYEVNKSHEDHTADRVTVASVGGLMRQFA